MRSSNHQQQQQQQTKDNPIVDQLCKEEQVHSYNLIKAIYSMVFVLYVILNLIDRVKDWLYRLRYHNYTSTPLSSSMVHEESNQLRLLTKLCRYIGACSSRTCHKPSNA
jgi:hypothetical protein